MIGDEDFFPCSCQEAPCESAEGRAKALEIGGAQAPRIEAISGGNGDGVPPVPIPNTEVKPISAESTWLETAREDRTPPDSNIYPP